MYVGGLVSVINFLGFSLVEMPVSVSGSGVPNQRLRVFVLFQLSTTWLNSMVKVLAPRLHHLHQDLLHVLWLFLSTPFIMVTFKAHCYCGVLLLALATKLQSVTVQVVDCQGC